MCIWGLTSDMQALDGVVPTSNPRSQEEQLEGFHLQGRCVLHNTISSKRETIGSNENV